MFNETNIFEILNEKYVLPKKVKLFEAFAGIGCQRMAFNRLGIEVDPIGISEIDKYAIASYNAIHGDTKNWGSICDIKGQDLPQIDVFTYSFPCTDLSKAGKQAGLNSTRSGLVYEVLRILQELKVVDRLPKCLIMENVVDLVQVKFIRQFQEIQLELEGLGYSNYAQTLNAKNYGVAQNRDRIFMVSVLGDKYYEFPKPFTLTKRLKDYLEANVDERYYLTDTFIKAMNAESGKFNRSERFEQSTHNDINNAVGFTISTKAGSRPTDNFISEPIAGQYQPKDRDYNKNKTKREEQFETRSDELSNSILTKDIKNMLIEPPIRIRKLTPLECWRLMGIDDTDFTKASQVCSNSQLYKQAGNGIVVDVFSAILSTMKGE